MAKAWKPVAALLLVACLVQLGGGFGTSGSAPFPSKNLAVLILSGDRSKLTRQQLNIVLRPAAVEKQIKAWGGDLRVWDDSVEVAGDDPVSVKFGKAMDAAQGMERPCVVISHGAKGWKGPLAKDVTPESFLSLLRKYGGVK